MTLAAWTTTPCWNIMAGAGKSTNPDLERFHFYFQRANSHTTVLAGASHAVYEELGLRELCGGVEAFRDLSRRFVAMRWWRVRRMSNIRAGESEPAVSGTRPLSALQAE